MTKIALVVLDTLRRDTFERHFDWIPGRYFTNAWSTSHWTVPVHASLFTGRYPSEVGVHARSLQLDYSDPVLAETLQRRGYDTVAFSANGNIVPQFDYDRGFDTFKQHTRTLGAEYDLFPWSEHLDSSDYPLPMSLVTGLVASLRGTYDTAVSIRTGIQQFRRKQQVGPGSADDGATDARALIRNHSFSDDAFVFLNLMEAHTPYIPPSGYSSRPYSPDETDLDLAMTLGDGPDNPMPFESAYDDCARYLSDVYRDIFDALSEFDYIITMSDHGEVFGTDGVWGHPHGLYPDLVHVPVVVTGPDRRDERCDKLVSLQDIYPTVLDAAGIDVETDGQSLLGTVEGRDRCRTEYHGLTHTKQLESLREQGFTEDEIRRYDRPLRGLARETAYGYETRDGFVFRGEEGHEEIRTQLEETAPPLDGLDRSGSNVDGDIQQRLEHLGYM